MADKNYTIKISVNMDTKDAISGTEKLNHGLSIMDGVVMGLGQKLVDGAVSLAKFGAEMAFNIGQQAVTAASNLQEQTQKFNVVFRDQIDIANQWSEVLVNSYAMSTRESRQYLAAMQDLLVPMGMNSEAAGQMSFNMVKLAADLGSFNNLPTEQVMLDLQSAIVGNYETTKKYGIILNETTVKQQAMNMGFEVGKGVLDPVIKAQAAYALMLKGSTNAIGDLSRSSDSYANTSKKLGSVWEDFTNQIGERLLPGLTSLARFLIDMAQTAMPYVGDAVQWLGTAFSDLGAWLNDNFIPVITNIYNFFTENDISEIWGVMLGIMWDAALEFAGNLDTWFWQIIGAVQQWGQDLVDFVWDQAEGPWDNAWAAFWDTAYIWGYNWYVKIHNYFAHGLEELVNRIIDTYNQIVAWLNKIPGINIEMWERYNADYEQLLFIQTEAQKNAYNEQANQTESFFATLFEKTTAGNSAIQQATNAHYNALTGAASNFTEFMSNSLPPAMNDIGQSTAAAYGEGFTNAWADTVQPAIGEAAQAAVDTFKAATSMITDWTGSSGQFSGYNYNGNFYYYNAEKGEWGYEDWRNGLPYWQSAGSGFMDWMEQQSSAYTGGFIDQLKGVIPSFFSGGEVPIIAHQGEVVIPTKESGYDYQGMQVDNGRVTGGGITVNLYHNGFLMDYDTGYKTAKIIGNHLKSMQYRGAI